MKSFKEYLIQEKAWYDKIVSMATRNIFARDDYELALKTLDDMLMRKRLTKDINHDIEYYATVIAKTYTHVDGVELADMYREAFPNQS